MLEHVGHHLAGDGSVAGGEEDTNVKNTGKLQQILLIQHLAPVVGGEEVLGGLLVGAEPHVDQEQLVEDDVVGLRDLLAPGRVMIMFSGKCFHDLCQPSETNNTLIKTTTIDE